MHRRISRLAVGTTAAAAAALVVVLSASMPATAGGEFGEHVSACARTSGFSGDHNPGMHQGFHRWDSSHAC